MKINTMKLTIIIFLLLMISGIIIGLFFIKIPDGNGEVFYMMAGMLLGIVSTIIVLMFKKEL